MNNDMNLLLAVFNLLLIIATISFAIIRFGLKRERHTFLNMTIDATTIDKQTDISLILITIHLENKGDTKIEARRAYQKENILYDDGFDKYLHAGTLKIRRLSDHREPTLVDWYALEPLYIATNSTSDDRVNTDYEQINYLDEYQDPESNFRQVHFWIEPHESYNLKIPIWLQSGIYAAKACFLGEIIKHSEEEYWSATTFYEV